MRKPFRVTGDMRSRDITTAALAYAKEGFHVLALHGTIKGARCTCGNLSCQSVGKHPIAKFHPNGHISATRDPKIIRAAFEAYPHGNVAIVPNDGLLVVDVDGPVGTHNVKHYNLPKTATVRTGRGRHYYLMQSDIEVPLPKIANVDYRQSGKGYVVAPPSRHASGRLYRWHVGRDITVELPRAFTAKRTLNVDFGGVSQRVCEGGRNERLTRYAGSMRRKGMSEVEIDEELARLNAEICDPPLSTSEVRQIAKSVAKYPAPHESAFDDISNVKEEPISWLYEPYIPRGCLTMLEGNPGVGKSQFICGIGANVSSGRSVPWAKDRPLGDVLILGAEDDAARVLKPRLLANGADEHKIRYQRDHFSLDESGIAALRREIEAHRPLLVIIDPVIAFIASGNDFNDAADMTRFLMQLDLIAREFDCAIVTVRHLRKTKDGSAATQGLGSIALLGRVRSCILLGRHPDDKHRRVGVHHKSSFEEEGPAIVFAINKGSDGRPRIEWLEQDENLTAQDVLNADSVGSGRPPAELQAATGHLRVVLGAGERDSAAIRQDAEARGISYATLRRAADALRVIKTRAGRRYMWRLPH